MIILTTILVSGDTQYICFFLNMGFNRKNMVQMLSIPLCTDSTDILILKISFSKDISHDSQMLKLSLRAW